MNQDAAMIELVQEVRSLLALWMNWHLTLHVFALCSTPRLQRNFSSAVPSWSLLNEEIKMTPRGEREHGNHKSSNKNKERIQPPLLEMQNFALRKDSRAASNAENKGGLIPADQAMELTRLQCSLTEEQSRYVEKFATQPPDPRVQYCIYSESSGQMATR
jgi:hypothetical protein